MTDEERAVDRERVEHRERIGDEIRGRVRVGGTPALAVAARVRRDKSQSSRDRVGEEVPVAAVVADAVEQERRWSFCAPFPRAQRDISTAEGA